MRIENIDWSAAERDLNAHGCALLPALLTAAECDAMAARYDGDGFRSTVTMARHGFGKGEYRYFAYPLPGPVAELRAGLYPPLAQIANRWNGALGERARSGRTR